MFCALEMRKKNDVSLLYLRVPCVRSKSPVGTPFHHAAQTSKLSNPLLLVAVAKVGLDEGRSREEFCDRSILSLMKQMVANK